MTEYSRRSFLKGAFAGGAALALGGMAGCAQAAQGETAPATYTYADTIAWNAEYDVVVVGFGGAGAAASIYAADAGASVLLCDVAPEGHEGGNTRYCAQIAVAGSNADDLLTYYKSLAWKFEMDEEVLRVYTQGMTEVYDIFKYIGVTEPTRHDPGSRLHKLGVFPEYPEAEAGDSVAGVTVNVKTFDSALWKQLRQAVMERSDSISVWLESPGKHLIQDPETGTIIGVEIEKQGETVLVRAKNGVVLTCGGFENNQQMIQDYLGAPRLSPLGTLYNRGDGIYMALEVGADLWHMNNYESLGILSGNTWRVEDGERADLEHSSLGGNALTVNSGPYGTGSVILVGDDGSRFLREDAHTRHGHTYYCGVYRIPAVNYNPYLVFDETQLAEIKEAGYLDEAREAQLVSAESPEALAEAIGLDPAMLAKSINDFNKFANEGVDYAFGRAAESMRPFSGSKYYAASFGAVILNTQGGPRRNASAQVVGPKGDPIPHLYSAGECGGVTAFHYNGGGNIAECLIFGRLAGQEAAKEKDPLPTLALKDQVEPAIAYALGQGDLASDGGTATVELAEGEYLGTSTEGIGGEIQVKVAYDGSTITAVEVVKNSETESIGGEALKVLPDEVIAANSAEVDVVTGATITSKAFMAAVADALTQAK